MKNKVLRVFRVLNAPKDSNESKDLKGLTPNASNSKFEIPKDPKDLKGPKDFITFLRL